MPKINVLSKNIAELIAAGEVVERPASVIKELMENSIDAGATSITVEIKNGGITYIRITDNGCGIEKCDVPLAFVSHATSKLKTADDLNSIFTLGFRGEALASVASVARVEMLTKAENEQVGTRYVIEGGSEVSYEDAGCPSGTTIVVRELFYNTPARMKFLKKDVSEANAVSAVVDRIALSHPSVNIRFIRDSKQALVTAGDGKLMSCARTVLGKEVSQTFVPVEYALDSIRVSGLVSKPAGSRATRSMQFFYLNDRFVKSKTAMAALEEAYKGTVMTSRFPACVLNISVDVHTVDVNVHPAKTEVRFSDERKIFSAVYYAVKSAITQNDTRPQADLTKLSSAIPVSRQPEAAQLKMTEKKKDDFWSHISAESFNNSLKLEQTVDESPILKDKKTEVQPAQQKAQPVFKITPVTSASIDISADDEADVKSEPVTEKKSPAVEAKDDAKGLDMNFIGEAFKTYIIVEQGDKLIFIDKHAAHERIIYESLKNKVDGSSQVLLSPVTVTLSKAEYSAVTENLSALSASGYAVEDFGTGTVIVRECPMYIEYSEIPSMIQEIADYLLSNKAVIDTEKLDWLLHNSACRAAIKAGDKTSSQELKLFAARLLDNPSIRYCPHGRPVMFEMSRRDIEKMFGRIQ